MKKGERMSDEAKKHLSLVRTGKYFHTEETKKKISLHNKAGTIAVRQKISLAKLGHKSSDETKKKVGKTTKLHWQDINYRNKQYMSILFGRNLRSQESINKFVATRTKNDTWNKKGMHTPETIELCREKRLHQVFPKKDSKPERMLQIALSLQGIQYEKHKGIIGQPDIFVEPNLCVFVDGCYFHGCQKCYPDNYTDVIPTKSIQKDSQVNHELGRLGYYVIRIWEHDIISGLDSTVNNIMSLIKSSSLVKFR